MKTYNSYLFVIVVTFLIGCESSPISSGVLNDVSTTIEFQLATDSYVTIKIENSYNTVVETPMDNVICKAGFHGTTLKINNLPAGIYTAFLEIKEIASGKVHKSTRTMLLM